MAKTLKMTFNLDNGKTSTMNLAQPKNDLTREDVEPFMQNIVDKDALIVGLAKATEIKGAIVEDVNKTQLI